MNNQQTHNSKRVYAHKSYFCNNFNRAISENMGVLHCKEHDYEEFLDETLEALLSEPFYTTKMKILSGPDGFILYNRKLDVTFSSTSELLDINTKFGLQFIRATPSFYLISHNLNISLGIVNCSLYSSRIVLKDDYHKKRMDVLRIILWSSTFWRL